MGTVEGFNLLLKPKMEERYIDVAACPHEAPAFNLGDMGTSSFLDFFVDKLFIAN